MTSGLIGRIVLAVIVAVVVGLLLVGLLGPLLLTLHVPIATTVGGFFVDFGWAIGVLAGIVYFLTHGAFRL